MKNPKHTFAAGLALLISSSAGLAAADTVRLANGDVIRGDVVALSEKELTIESENFGQMKIPRSKVQVIGLGDKPLDEMLGTLRIPGAVPGARTTDAMPSLQNPEVQQQLNRVLQQALGGGLGGIGNMQQDLNKTQRGLKDLQRDLGPGPSADALDGYIKMFELFGGGAAAGNEGNTNPPATNRQGADN